MPDIEELKSAAEWIDQFEAAGGFVFSDGETLTIGQKFLGCSLADQAEARHMITAITSELELERTVH